MVVREIDCGDWLARRCMPAHQHCDLLYPPSWGCDWVYHKLGNTPILRSGTGSWVLSGSLGVRHPLSPVIGWVFETQTNKQVSQISVGTCSYAFPYALDWLLQPVLLDSTTSSCCCTFSIEKARSSAEDPGATGGLVPNLSHPWVNKAKQHRK